MAREAAGVAYAPAAGDDLDWIYDTIAEVATAKFASGYEQSIRAHSVRSSNTVRGAERCTTICAQGYGRSVSSGV